MFGIWEISQTFTRNFTRTEFTLLHLFFSQFAAVWAEFEVHIHCMLSLSFPHENLKSWKNSRSSQKCWLSQYQSAKTEISCLSMKKTEKCERSESASSIRLIKIISRQSIFQLTQRTRDDRRQINRISARISFNLITSFSLLDGGRCWQLCACKSTIYMRCKCCGWRGRLIEIWSDFAHTTAATTTWLISYNFSKVSRDNDSRPWSCDL